MSPHISPKLQTNMFEGSYLQSGLDDVLTPSCLLPSGRGIKSWWCLPQWAALQSLTLLRQGGRDTESWRMSGRGKGGPESADSSFSSAVPDGWHQAGWLADCVCWGKTRSSFYQQTVLRPFLLTCVSLSALMSWFALHVFCVVLMFSLILKLLLYVIHSPTEIRVILSTSCV